MSDKLLTIQDAKNKAREINIRCMAGIIQTYERDDLLDKMMDDIKEGIYNG